MTIKLSDTQLVLMSAAAQREDHCLVAPQHLKGGAAKKVAEKLIGAGVLKEIRARAGAPVWRRDEEDCDIALKLTAAGLKAIAVEDDAEGTTEEAGDAGAPLARSSRGRSEASAPNKFASLSKARSAALKADAQMPEGPTSGRDDAVGAAPRTGSKLAMVIGLLRRDGGATLEELVEATGWLPHTTRAALTGLRKRNFAVERDMSDNVRGSVYRLAGGRDREGANVGTRGGGDPARTDAARSTEEGGPIPGAGAVARPRKEGVSGLGAGGDATTTDAAPAPRRRGKQPAPAAAA